MFTKKVGPRAEHQQAQRQRVMAAATMADKFSHLKSLDAELQYVDPVTGKLSNPVKYSVNITNAKSVFRFRCPNTECVRGDFDLTEHLAKAARTKKKAVKGELVCEGWRSSAKIGAERCGHVLRYKLALKY
jgi:hypothetical protein